MEFSRQESWSGLPFPSPGDFPNPEIELMSLVSPALQADSLPSELPEKSAQAGQLDPLAALLGQVGNAVSALSHCLAETKKLRWHDTPLLAVWA